MKPVHLGVERPGSITVCRPVWPDSVARRSMRCAALSLNACSASIISVTQMASTTVVPVSCTSNELINRQAQTSCHHGTGEALAGDFVAHAQAAIPPAWQVRTVQAHWEQAVVGQGTRATCFVSGMDACEVSENEKTYRSAA